MKRLAFGVALAVLLLLAVAGGLLGYEYRAFLERPLGVPPGGVTVHVQRGDTARAAVQRLEQAGLTRSDWRWRLLLRLRPVTIQAGEYHLPHGIEPPAVLAKMARGDVVRYRFTIVEGWNYRQLRDALLSDPVLVADPDALQESAVMDRLESERDHPEGWFLPETYSFVRGDTALGLLRRAHAAMQDALGVAWSSRDPGLPLQSPKELLILASIVEKETALESERARIAGVFVRRLARGWRLETDPSVIYGLGENWDGDLREGDLRKDSPYNTYTRHGLPPTPIAMPGRASLLATARPESGTAMFFVADGTGGHVFSDTLEQHARAVRELVRRQRDGR